MTDTINYQIVDMVERTGGNPTLFTPPPPGAVKKLWVGANVQVYVEALNPIMLEADDNGNQQPYYPGEAMWVTITNLTDPKYIIGVLNLDSTVIPDLKARTLVKFTPNSILDIDFWDNV